MNRREFLKNAGAGVALMALVASLPPAARKALLSGQTEGTAHLLSDRATRYYSVELGLLQAPGYSPARVVLADRGSGRVNGSASWTATGSWPPITHVQLVVDGEPPRVAPLDHPITVLAGDHLNVAFDFFDWELG